MLSLPLGDIFNLIQGERVFEAVHVHLTIVVLEVSVQEWDEILLLTLFIESVCDQPGNASRVARRASGQDSLLKVYEISREIYQKLNRKVLLLMIL